MTPDVLRQLLEQVQAGRLSVEAALRQCQEAPVADLGYAQVDLQRRQRCGFPEVIFCEGKTAEWIEGVVCQLVAAGMDGALPSVVGGLVDCPVIAVPTSIGYGAAFNGLAPLLTMLNACSANVVVVNIDSGFKGGYVAALIARRAAQRGGAAVG